MGEGERAARALAAAAAALEEAMPEALPDLDFLVMLGGALLCVALLAAMLPRSR